MWQFFVIDVYNNSVAVCNIRDCKLSRGSNPKSFLTSPFIQPLRNRKKLPPYYWVDSGLVCRSVDACYRGHLET